MLRDAFQDVYCIHIFLCRCNFYGLGYIQFLRLHNMYYICTLAFSHDILKNKSYLGNFAHEENARVVSEVIEVHI